MRRAKLVETEGDLTNRLIASLKAMVANGSIQPGGRLPPERTLAAQYGVNRTSLRMALTALEVMGVLVRRVGDGTYLSTDNGAILQTPLDFLILVDEISPQDLMEARLILEPELAARAAERATLQHLSEMRAALRVMEEPGADLKHLAEADIAFHAAVARASGNRTFYRMFSVINRAMQRLLSLTLRSEPLSQKVKVHTGICDAIDRRDPDLARQLMRTHLEETLAFVRQSPALKQRLPSQVFSGPERPPAPRR